MKKAKQESERPPAPDGLTLPELHDRLGWFGVHVSVGALRQALRELAMEPFHRGLSRSGRGQSSYYGFPVLWTLATAYHAAYSPKTKFEHVSKLLSEMELSYDHKLTIAEFFVDDEASTPSPATRNHAVLREVYMWYVTHADDGLDLRIVVDVARDHWTEVGLDDDGIRTQLIDYKRRTLERLGVPPEVTAKLGLI